jgi:glucose-fructose oxidoreductase
MNRKIRYAVVGLGHIAQTAVLPAFKHAENSQLAALVTGNPKKNYVLSERYGLNAYNYDDLEEAFEKEHVNAAYIATRKWRIERILRQERRPNFGLTYELWI